MKIPKGCVAHLCVFPHKKIDCRECHNYIDNVINEYEKVVIEAIKEGEKETEAEICNYIEDVKNIALTAEDTNHENCETN